MEHMVEQKAIAIISNDLALVRFLRRHLDDGQYRVATTQCRGDSLRRKLRRLHPNLVLLDVMMPGFEGIAIALYVRQWLDAPIVLLSTWQTGWDEVRAFDVNASDYLTDPFTAEELVGWIEGTLDRERGSLDMMAGDTPWTPADPRKH
jgi:two-component system response regulator MtrA